MTIIIGLGNPGEKFNNTRHNAGFMAVDFFAKKNELPEFEMEKKYDALISKKGNILLAKPETFMNKSGSAVKKIAKNNKGQIIVVHDDADLPVGKIKIAVNRGSAGHKGIESIIKAVGNKNLVRFRLGISGGKKSAEDIVLKKFSKKEMEEFETVIKKTANALDFFIENGLEKTMNEFNR